MIGSSQHGFMKEKLCLANPIAFYNEMNGVVDEGRAVGVFFYLDFSQAFSTVFYNILTDRLMKYGLAKWTRLKSQLFCDSGNILDQP